MSNGWISIDDKLPESCKNVLLFGKKSDNTFVVDCGSILSADLVAKYGVENSFTSCDLVYVTHWQPLPEPPKE